jgi:hypothetical protein
MRSSGKRSRVRPRLPVRRARAARSKLLGIGGQPIGAKQKGVESATGAHAKQEPSDQGAVTPRLYHPAQPKTARNSRKRRGRPRNAADDVDAQFVGVHSRQEHPSSGLEDEVFVEEAPALVSALALPVGHGALVEAEARATVACTGQPYANSVTMAATSSCGLCAR